jgi:integrase
MSRRALIRKRCSSCGATIPDEVCPKGHRRWTWSFTVDVNPSGARRRQITRSGYSTKVEAQRALDELKVASSRGEYVEPSRLTVGAYIDERWIPAVQARVRPSTFESYQKNLRLHVLPAIGEVRLQALQPSDLNALYALLLKSGRRNRTGGGLSGRTVRYIHAILRKALSDADRWSLVVRNVADLADPPPTRTTRPPKMHTWTSDEVRSFLEHVRRDRLAAMWVMFVTTGMRRGEVLGLSWSETYQYRHRTRLTAAAISQMGSLVPRVGQIPTKPVARRVVGLLPQGGRA